MSRRGEIVIECSSDGCHAEEVITPAVLRHLSVNTHLREMGWAIYNSKGRDICPQCVEEGKS